MASSTGRIQVVGALGALLAFALAGAACSANSADSNAGASGGAGGSNSGGAGGGGSGGTGGTLGGSNGSGGTGLVGGCAHDTYGGVLLPLDLYLILDRSSSMNESNKWGAVTGAINQFAALPGLEDVSMGLAFFPQPKACSSGSECGSGGVCTAGRCAAGPSSDSCSPPDYSNPAVPMAAFPGVATQIGAALAATQPLGGTPTLFALQGAIQYARGWAQSHTGHLAAVVLATDGEPLGCGFSNSVTSCASEAATSFGGTPSVPVFVIGVGDLGALDAIAQAGGTGSATLLDATDAGQAFLDALNHVRGSVGCQYELPDLPPGEPFDSSAVNVAFTPTGGAQDIFGHVETLADCQSKQGWYYDDPANPTKILFCPAACDAVTQSVGSVDIVVGCSTIPA